MSFSRLSFLALFLFLIWSDEYNDTQIDLSSPKDGLGTRISNYCHANPTDEVRTESLPSILAWRRITSTWLFRSTSRFGTHLVWRLSRSISSLEEQIYWRNQDDYPVSLFVMAWEFCSILSQGNPRLQEVSHAFVPDSASFRSNCSLRSFLTSEESILHVLVVVSFDKKKKSLYSAFTAFMSFILFSTSVLDSNSTYNVHIESPSMQQTCRHNKQT